jgi:hypothetical protein
LNHLTVPYGMFLIYLPLLFLMRMCLHNVRKLQNSSLSKKS